MPEAKAAPQARGKKSEYQDKEKPAAIRFSNVSAAKGKLVFTFALTMWAC